MANRKVLLVFLDIMVCFIALYLGVMLRFNSLNISEYYNAIGATGILFSAIVLTTYYLIGLYHSLWKHASVEELVKLIFSSFISIVLLFIVNEIWFHHLPNSVFAIAFLLQTGLSGASRFSYRVLRVLKNIFISKSYKNQQERRIIVIGSGFEAAATINNINNRDTDGYVLALVDRINNRGAMVHNVKVEGTLKELEQIIQRFLANEVIIASEIFIEDDMGFTLQICSKLKCRVKKYDAIGDVGHSNMIVDIDPKDLLGRAQVKLDEKGINTFLKDKTVLVTGGGGSIGSELIKQMAKYKPKHILIIDMFENDAYLTKLYIERKFSNIKVDVLIASVRDKNRMCEIFEKYSPDIVFHAAAHKHVPLMEKAPNEALKNNILGTYIVAKCASQYKAKKFVLVSTDKAVNPTNIMGATKRVAEIIMSAFNLSSTTEYSAVRFGNVLGSSGSVIPIFRQQIEEGGPVRVTHPDVRRYFMTIEEACQLVIQAGAIAKGGEIFILDMHKPVRIRDLAENLIRLYGYVPGTDIEIEYTGLRPGEKLYEEIMLDTEATETNHEKIFIAIQKEYKLDIIEKYMATIFKTIQSNKSTEEVIKVLQIMVPELKPLNIQQINEGIKQ